MTLGVTAAGSAPAAASALASNRPNVDAASPTVPALSPSVARSLPGGQWAREWARFVDWCTATDRVPLPAATETVLAYLTAENPTRGSAGRWVAAVRAHHHAAGHPDPCHGLITAWLRRTRSGPLGGDLSVVFADLIPRAAALPSTGWPVGLFGRRDRLALILHHLAAMPAPALVALAATDLTITAPRRLSVTTSTGVFDLPAGEDGVVCPACAALRWRWVLHHAADYNHRALATSLAAAPEPGHLVHLCDRVEQPLLGGPPGWPLLPAITRWGHTSLPPVPAMTIRAVQELLRRARNPDDRRPAAVTPALDDACAPPVAAPAQDPDWHQRGLTARARTHHSLEAMASQWDQVDTVIDRLTDRTRELLDNLADDQG